MEESSDEIDIVIKSNAFADYVVRCLQCPSCRASNLQPDVVGVSKVSLGEIAPPQHIALGITYLIDIPCAQG